MVTGIRQSVVITQMVTSKIASSIRIEPT